MRLNVLGRFMLSANHPHCEMFQGKFSFFQTGDMLQRSLTILFSTRNGEKVLPRTLSAYVGLRQPSVSWKLIIVDNGSSNSTPEILKSFQEKLPIEDFV